MADVMMQYIVVTYLITVSTTYHDTNKRNTTQHNTTRRNTTKHNTPQHKNIRPNTTL